jgi:hypothetical protein
VHQLPRREGSSQLNACGEVRRRAVAFFDRIVADAHNHNRCVPGHFGRSLGAMNSPPKRSRNCSACVCSAINVTEPDERVCTMEYSLHEIALPAIVAFNKTEGIRENRAVLDQLTALYKERPLDPTKMKPADAARYRQVMQVLGPMFKHLDFVRDIERFKLMARAADINAQSKAQDLTFAGGDIRKVGSTLNAMLARKELDETTQMALRTWFLVNERIPADVVSALGAVTGATK